MKLLAVSEIDQTSHAVSTITRLAQAGHELGHEVAIFGEQRLDIPNLTWSLDIDNFDFAVFVVYETKDFPDLPYLARLLDGVPKERRVVIDCCGRYNDTIRIEHDFNHLEKLDGHQGWEWVEGFEAISDKILQPTLRPLKENVRPFLFHAFSPTDVSQAYDSPQEATQAWSTEKDYSLAYVGHNWQRWSQLGPLLEATEMLQPEFGKICLVGYTWNERPDWAEELGLKGVDVDVDLIKRLDIETRWPIPFNEVVPLLSQAQIAPIIHRPLFNHLGLVTNRTFETFAADTLPLLMLPFELAEDIYGPDCSPLIAGTDPAGKIQDMLGRPEFYWEVVFKVRQHLAKQHSFRERFRELVSILES